MVTLKSVDIRLMLPNWRNSVLRKHELQHPSLSFSRFAKWLRQLSFAEFVVTGHKSNRTSKTNNQNPFKRILTTDKIRSNGILLFDFNQTKPIVQITTNSAKLKWPHDPEVGGSEFPQRWENFFNF